MTNLCKYLFTVKGVAMKRKINELEMSWINALLAVDFMGKDILMNQIAESEITVEENDAYYWMRFNIGDSKDRFPYDVRVPVIMIANQEDTAPIIFLLHVINGYVDELEIYIADLSVIDITSIDLGNVEYNIDVAVSRRGDYDDI